MKETVIVYDIIHGEVRVEDLTKQYHNTSIHLAPTQKAPSSNPFCSFSEHH